jgi:hypothetical protein
MKTLSVSLFRRPLYAALTLSAIARCEGIEAYHVLINIDAGTETREYKEVSQAVKPLLRSVRWMQRSGPNRGCNASVVSCVDWGFESGSDFHVHLEDDTLPHRDFLRFVEWSNRRFFDDKDVLTVSGYCNKPGYDSSASGRRWFTPWGWATWQDRWDEIRGKLSIADALSWDHQINRIRDGRLEVYPRLGRILNIGQHDGTYNNQSIWSAEQFNPVWAGSVAPKFSASTWAFDGAIE